MRLVELSQSPECNTGNPLRTSRTRFANPREPTGRWSDRCWTWQSTPGTFGYSRHLGRVTPVTGVPGFRHMRHGATCPCPTDAQSSGCTAPSTVRAGVVEIRQRAKWDETEASSRNPSVRRDQNMVYLASD